MFPPIQRAMVAQIQSTMAPTANDERRDERQERGNERCERDRVRSFIHRSTSLWRMLAARMVISGLRERVYVFLARARKEDRFESRSVGWRVLVKPEASTFAD
jgi:hypothetical protein